MVFHEITPAAIAKAVSETGTSTCVSSTPRRAAASSTASSATKSLRTLARVDKADRRRVQSVAIRLVCERERERMDFTSATWFDVTAA